VIKQLLSDVDCFQDSFVCNSCLAVKTYLKKYRIKVEKSFFTTINAKEKISNVTLSFESFEIFAIN
jgi:hypothetical protein